MAQLSPKAIQLKKMLKADRYDMRDFWMVCPFEPRLVISDTRKAEIRAWRQIGMCWMHLSGMSMANSGKFFERDHATVFHALKNLIISLEGFGEEYVRESINELMTHVHQYAEISESHCENEAVSTVLLEAEFSKKFRFFYM